MILEFITIVVLVIGLVILFYNKVRINYVVVTKTIRPITCQISVGSYVFLIGIKELRKLWGKGGAQGRFG